MCLAITINVDSKFVHLLGRNDYHECHYVDSKSVGSNHTVNGQDSSTDAQTMADIKGGSSSLWACLWLVLGIIFMILGIVFAIPGPDEVADFTCCGVCQDLGLFQLCNYPGQRLFSGMLDRWKGRNNNADNNNNNNANETTTTFNGAGNNFDCAA